MSPEQKLADNIASHLRKIEELQNILKSTSRLLEHETACLHQCLDQAARIAQVTINTKTTTPNGQVTPFGGGIDKK
jgi:hypothetical protein